MFSFERVFKVIGEPNFKLPGEEQGDFIDDVYGVLHSLDFNFQDVGIKLTPKKNGFQDFTFQIINSAGINPPVYELNFNYKPDEKWLRVYSCLSERQSALVIQFLLEHYLRVEVEEQPEPGRTSFKDLCRKLESDHMRRKRLSGDLCDASSPLMSRAMVAKETLKWMRMSWKVECEPAFAELFEVLSGKRVPESYQSAMLFQANRPVGNVKYNPIIKYLKSKSALEIYEAKLKLSPDRANDVQDILSKFDSAWNRLLPLCVKVYKSAGMELQSCYRENARTAKQIAAQYAGTSSAESKVKNDRAFRNLCKALDDLAKMEIEGDCIAKYYGRVSRVGELAQEQTKIEPPDFANLESCRQFCNTLYAEVREKLKSRVHSETQAVSYILSGAKEGDLYYEDCLIARRIKKDWNWTRTTFTTYCKQKAAPKPKTIKRAAKKGRHIRERNRMLRDL